jgi:DNA replication factor GINS
MNLDELRTVQSSERQSDRLQHLRDGFYEEVGEYVRELKTQREQAADDADDPYGAPEVRRLTDEIETATTVVEAIWEARIGKLVNQASLAATDMGTVDDAVEGLTDEERDLFEQVVAAIEANNARIQTALDAEAPIDASSDDESPHASSDARTPDDTTATAADDPAAAETAADDPGPVAPDEPDTQPTATEAPVAGGDTGAEAPRATDEPATIGDDTPSGDAVTTDDGTATSVDGGAAGPASTERETVQITEDIGEIAGMDEREYHLEADDVAMLPSENADALVERDAARRLE